MIRIIIAQTRVIWHILSFLVATNMFEETDGCRQFKQKPKSTRIDVTLLNRNKTVDNQLEGDIEREKKLWTG